MKKSILVLFMCGYFISGVVLAKDIIKLSKPVYSSDISIEEALLKRRSVRKFNKTPVTVKEISQLLWAAQGITNEKGYRTAPSAGASYPLQMYVIIQNAKGIKKGIYKYIPQGHKLEKVKNTGVIDLKKITFQRWVSKSPVIFAITADYNKVIVRYGKRGVKYTDMEAGHTAQNIQLQGISLGIGSCVIGAFDEEETAELLNLSKYETPIYLIGAGKK